MNGFEANVYSMTGCENKNLSDIYNQTLTTTNIISDYYNGIPKQDLLYLSGLSDNVQNQINAMSLQIVGGNGGGGSFILFGESNVGFNPLNNSGYHWVHGSGTIGYIGLTLPACILVGLSINCTIMPSSSVSVVIIKNLNNYASTTATITLSTIQTTNTIMNLTSSFLLGETCTIKTNAGSGGGLVRLTAIFQTIGVTGDIGPTPNISIGSVSDLTNGTNPYVTVSGTTTNPILNFGLEQGIKGDKGDRGERGERGESTISAWEAAGVASGAATVAVGAATDADISAEACAGAVVICEGVSVDIAGLQTEVDTLGAEMTDVENDLIAVTSKTQNQNASILGTIFENNFTVGTPLTSAIIINGSVCDINCLSINLNGIVSSPMSGFSMNSGFFSQF